MWSNSQKITFDMITIAPVLAYYNPLKGMTCENYTCEYVLGAVLKWDIKHMQAVPSQTQNSVMHR